MVTWLKHWHREQVAPLGVRRGMAGLYYARRWAEQDYDLAAQSQGLDHPATRAALGRLLFYKNAAPQRGDRSIESIAWHRESGAIHGYLNRAERKHASE